MTPPKQLVVMKPPAQEMTTKTTATTAKGSSFQKHRGQKGVSWLWSEIQQQQRRQLFTLDRQRHWQKTILLVASVLFLLVGIHHLAFSHGSSSPSVSLGLQIQVPPYEVRIISPAKQQQQGTFAAAAASSSSSSSFQKQQQKQQQQQQQRHSSRVVQTWYTAEDRHDWMKQHGEKCWPGMTKHYLETTTRLFLSTDSDGGGGSSNNSSGWNHEIELWKYCALYLGLGTAYWHTEEVRLLVHDASSLFAQTTHGIAMVESMSSNPHHDDGNGGARLVHPSLLQLPNREVAREMCRILVESQNPSPPLPHLISRSLYTLLKTSKQQQQQPPQVDNDDDNTTIVWWELTCIDLITPEDVQCPLLPNGYCCQAYDSLRGNNNNKDKVNPQVLALVRHPLWTQPQEVTSGSTWSSSSKSLLVSTIDVRRTHLPRPSLEETPNFFDILLRNDCLPTQKQCHKCLKKTGDCHECEEACGCFCKALCIIRPPPKTVTQIWTVSPPTYRKDPHRLIPRIIHQVRSERERERERERAQFVCVCVCFASTNHSCLTPTFCAQTWFEPVSKEKYPNMSRLIESWRRSGWEYNFYDDATAGDFLAQHFPPEVLEAYNAILPGAFKADLFRYCVLLIRGGVYADMDVLLTTQLDSLLEGNVGFMVPMDEPGIKVGHRSCLWNGLLAVAPGHPFLARTIEMVVNNIRNRYTSVDYDDMLCPNPVLSVSHTVDTLFTCGPCILGAAMNQVLHRHPQSEWELGDVDLWGASENGNSNKNKKDLRHFIPGRTVILQQNKQDMGAHRFTWVERNVMVASTDMPDYDDRPPTKQHYSKTHEKVGVYGLRNLYKDQRKANELIDIQIADIGRSDTA